MKDYEKMLINFERMAKADFLVALAETKPIFEKYKAEYAGTIIRIEYDGVGDSGDIESIFCFEKYENIQKGIIGEFYSAIEKFAWAVIEFYHWGYENNEGGSGLLEIDIDTFHVGYQHADRIVTTIDHKHTINLNEPPPAS